MNNEHTPLDYQAIGNRALNAEAPNTLKRLVAEAGNTPLEPLQETRIDWHNLQSETKSNRHIVTEVFHHFSMPDDVISVNLHEARNVLSGGTFSSVKIKFPEWEGQKEFYAFMWMNPDATDNFLQKMIRHRAFSITIEDESTMCLPVLIDHPARGVAFVAIKGLIIEYYNFYDPSCEQLSKWLQEALSTAAQKSSQSIAHHWHVDHPTPVIKQEYVVQTVPPIWG